MTIPLVEDLDVYAGDTGTWSGTWFVTVGQVHPGTGWEITGSVRRGRSSEVTLADLVCEWLVEADGTFTFVLDAGDSATLPVGVSSCVYDVQATKDTDVRTLATGAMNVTKDVTRDE